MVPGKDHFQLNFKSVQGTISRSEVGNSVWCNVVDNYLIVQADITLIDRDGGRHPANGFLLHLMFPTFRSISASRLRDLEAVSLDTSPEVVALVVNWAYGMGRLVVSYV